MTSLAPASFVRLALISLLFAYVVVLLGAYTRLADAGLGCPDWPGCFGQLIAPTSPEDIAAAKARHPDVSVDSPKAWTEMVHRYAAGTLGLLIAGLAVVGWRLRRIRPGLAAFSAGLLALVVFQAALGMWTVTLQLKPLVVMGHLLGGLTLLVLLGWVVLREQRFFRPVVETPMTRRLRPFAVIGLILVFVQIALGGWTSANYAALVCPDFPTCQGVWWPQMDFAEGFTLWRGVGINYEGGVLSLPAATAVHMAHRIGALVTFFYVGGLALYVLRANAPDKLCRYALPVLLLLLAQVALGVVNVLAHLPVAIAVAHNGVAALLLLSLAALNHAVRPGGVRTPL